MNLVLAINYFDKILWSLPVLLFIVGVALYISLQLKFVQISYFSKAISLVFHKDSNHKDDGSENLSPLQAFMNTLGANIGNGSLAGIAVAVCSGGPGAIIWLIALTTLLASLRYAEVFLSSYFVSHPEHKKIEAPVAYIGVLPGGIIWADIMTFILLGFGLAAGALAQSHAIGLAVHTSLAVSEVTTGFFILMFVVYMFLGGAKRIVALLDKMVPIKVVLFLITAIIILIYHYQSIPHALYLMLNSALHPQAVLGGAFGFALQKAMTVGFQQGVFASEAGLGSAAVAFSATQGKNPVENGFLAMLGVFINTHVICFLFALCLIASGVWDCGQTSSALVVLTYESVFGTFGGWLVLVLIINFAMSVLVAGAFNGQRCWNYLFGTKISWMYPVIYSLTSFCGAWMQVDLVWKLNNIVNTLLLIMNTCGLLWSLKIIKKELKAYRVKND